MSNNRWLTKYHGEWRISEHAVEPKQYNWMRSRGSGPMTVAEAGKLMANMSVVAGPPPAPVLARYMPARDAQGNVVEKLLVNSLDPGLPPRAYVLAVDGCWRPKHQVDCSAAPAPAGPIRAGSPAIAQNGGYGPGVRVAASASDDPVRYVSLINGKPYGQRKSGGFSLLPPGAYSDKLIGCTLEEIQAYWKRGSRLDVPPSPPPPAAQAAPRCGCGAAAVGCPHAIYCDLYVPVAACGPHSDADDDY